MLTTAAKLLKDGCKATHRGDFRSALEKFSEGIHIEPDNGLLWYNVGIVSHRLGAHEQSKHAFEKATALQPDLAPAWTSLGMELIRLGDLELLGARRFEVSGQVMFQAMVQSVRPVTCEEDRSICATIAIACTFQS